MSIHDTLAPDFAADAAIYGDRPSTLLNRVKNFAYLDMKVFPPMRWAVHGLVPEGFGLFTGAPKVGKSWLTLDLALATANGSDALGRIQTGEPRPVLLLALEDGERRLQGRARHLLGEGVPLPELLDYATLADIEPDEVVPMIEQWLERHSDSGALVILDTLGKVMPESRSGEGAYQRDYRIGSTLKRLVDAHPGSCLLVVHHVRKATSEDWMDSTSGTNGLNGAADFTINFSRLRNEDGGVLRVTGRDVPEGEYAVTYDGIRWTIDGTGLADAARKAIEDKQTDGLGDRSSEIVHIVSEHPDGVGPTEVARTLGISAKDASQYLGRLVESGRIAKPRRGTYTPVVSVVSVVNGEDPTSQYDTYDGYDTPPEGSQCRIDAETAGRSLREKYLGGAT